MRTAKTLIRLGGCPGWSESSLGAHAILLVLSWGGSFLPSLITLWSGLRLEDSGLKLLHTKLISAWRSVFGRAQHIQLLGFCCSSISVLVLLSGTHLVSSQCWILIYMFSVLMQWCVGHPSRGPNKLYFSESLQSLRRGLLERKIGLNPG